LPLDEVNWLNFSPNDRTIMAGEASGRVHFMRLEGLPVGKGAKHQNISIA